MPPRCFCLFLFSLFPAFVQGGDLLDYLKNYEGRWVGHFTIHSTANGYTESFPVEQRYWLKEEVLHGLAVTGRQSGVETATSKTWVEGEKLIAEIKRGQVKEAFYGVLHDGGVLWLPVKLERANDYQMRESFRRGEGNRPPKLLLEGFDTYVFAGGIAHLVIKGELKLEAAADTAD